MKTIRQTIFFKSPPFEVYEALMDSAKHSKFTGAKAEISRKEAEVFTAYDRYIEGVNIDLVPGKRIVQEWRGSDWPEGHYSTVTFDLKDIGWGTKLVFTQTEVPDEHAEAISQGWKEHYWDKLKPFLEK